MKLHEKHRGHESMHAEMILILFATLVISQIALVKWKQIYPSSYHVSLNGCSRSRYLVRVRARFPDIFAQCVLRYPKNGISRAQSKIQTFFKCLDPSKLISVKNGC